MSMATSSGITTTAPSFLYQVRDGAFRSRVVSRDKALSSNLFRRKAAQVMNSDHGNRGGHGAGGVESRNDWWMQELLQVHKVCNDVLHGNFEGEFEGIRIDCKETDSNSGVTVTKEQASSI